MGSIKKHKSFGHIALSYTNRRTATIVSRKNVHLLSLQKSFFTEIGSKINQQTEVILDFLKSAFPGLSTNHLANLMSKMKEKTYRMNTKILEKGKFPKFCYIIKSGEVKVIFYIIF